MGQGITITCKQCAEQDSLLIGVGMSHFSIETVLPHLRGKPKEALKNIIDKQEIQDSTYAYEVFECTHCNTLHSRFYVKVDYKDQDGKPADFETHFKCGKCRKALLKKDEDIEQIIHQYRCKKCGAKALEQELGLLWD